MEHLPGLAFMVVVLMVLLAIVLLLRNITDTD